MSRELSSIVSPLLRWYDKNKRELPWRKDREPYHVWISEIMLQQTRIEAVINYYTRFTGALPDVRSLSEVDDDRLMKLWEGLGYYSRARNLKKAAMMITDDYGGVFPSAYRELILLPGVGEYTAGAIASICFDEKVAAVDGNVLRVVARLLGSRENVLLPQTKKAVAEQLTSILPDRAGAFNEALMELGELVCLPNGTPRCESCPLRACCAAFEEELVAELPVREKKLKRKSVEKTVFLITAPDGRLAIEKRPDSGLLAGMYQLPNTEGFLTLREIRAVISDWGLVPASVSFVKNAKHVFTHIDWNMKSYRVQVDKPAGRFLWVSPEERKSAYPLPTAFQKLLRQEEKVR